MKIGIMSMQRIYNYGSFMQSYALKKTVESLGHQVVFIDIKPGRQLEEEIHPKYNRAKLLLSKFDRHLFKRIEHHQLNKKMYAIFKETLKNELGVEDRNDNEYCDVVIIGSDEVFNCTQLGKPFGCSMNLFGADVNAERVVSYAASFGHTTMCDLDKYGIADEVGRNLHNFSAISVRDKNSATLVEHLAGVVPQEHADPVIIGDFDSRIPEPKCKNYIAVYAYGNRIKSKEEIRAIKDFAHKQKKKLIGVGMYQMWCDINVIGSPFEIVGYIKHADYVITDTFHGCVFSIKYQKQFAAFVRDSNRNKLIDLLERFSVGNRLIERVDDLENIICQPINTDHLMQRIEDEKKRTIVYLSENLR